MDSSYVHRKESIVFTAIDFIHEFGIQSVSTKEIAKRLGISESTIFKHFPKKNDLLMAVLDQFSLYDNDIFRTAISKKKDPREAITFFIDSYTGYYENYPAITALVQAYDVFRSIPELKEKAIGIVFHRLECMEKLVLAAQESGELRDDTDSALLAEMLISTCRGISLRWRMKEHGFSLREETLKAVRMLLDAFSK